MRTQTQIWVFLMLFLAATPLLAAETPGKERIQQLVLQLGDADWNKRAAATEELKKAGSTAIPFLEEAAQSRDEEVRTRAKTILKSIRAAEEEAKKPKQDELGGLGALGGQGLGDLGPLLEQMMKGFGGQGGAGGQGGQAMDLSALLMQMLSGLQGAQGGQGGAAGQLDLGALLGQLGGVQGALTPPKLAIPPPTVYKEQDKQYIISHKIIIQIIEQKDGKETVRRVEADDEKDLEKKDPEAYRIYKQALQPDSALPIQIKQKP